MSVRELVFVSDRSYVTEPGRRVEATHIEPHDLIAALADDEPSAPRDDVGVLRAAAAAGEYLDYGHANAEQRDRALMLEYAKGDPPPTDDTVPSSSIVWLPHPAFARTPGVASTVSELLLLGFGVLQTADFLGVHTVAKKGPPSKGARHPFVAYVAVGGSDQLPSGLFRYRPWEHALERIGESSTDGSALHLVVTMRYERLHWRYRETAGYSDGLLDLGHLVAVLAATARRLELEIDPVSAASGVPDAVLVEEAVLAWRIRG